MKQHPEGTDSAPDYTPDDKSNHQDLLAHISLVQAGYYMVTGIWPLVSIGTFQKITGPKTDLWLVKTAGVLITAIGSVLGMAGLRKQPTQEITLLAVTSAVGLAGIDIIYVAKRRISPIYLLDALAEFILIGAWAFAWRKRVASG